MKIAPDFYLVRGLLRHPEIHIDRIQRLQRNDRVTGS